MKPTIRLYDAVGTGVILTCQSGVMVSNQTGGTACLQPEVEGVYVPLRNDYSAQDFRFSSPELELSAYFEGPKHRGAGAISGLDSEDAEFIDDILSRHGLNESISVDREKLGDSHEAWVHVVVKADESHDEDLAQFTGFGPYPRHGILTWANSD
ncbi:DUF6210 family protein [Prosthecobacter vanneervenii]|uniref:Uncharacterized protein n=1 Tax=Prosthecobacter vanneervenii TaxID=48466 RepID=A0A7W7Y6L4_9BACT|nr:DUF6210 family protein [Prosthecobacter vanneervenii]MBB5030547.1 hypothetical protein [Prosthecobacter vanneervenii]